MSHMYNKREREGGGGRELNSTCTAHYEYKYPLQILENKRGFLWLLLLVFVCLHISVVPTAFPPPSPPGNNNIKKLKMDPYYLGLLGVWSAYGVVASSAAAAWYCPAATVPSGLSLLEAGQGVANSRRALGPLCCALAGVISHYYALLFTQTKVLWRDLRKLKETARAEGKKPPSLSDVKYGAAKTPSVLAAERTAGNQAEQLPALLVGACLHTVLVDADGAAKAVWLWLALRSAYGTLFVRPYPGVLLCTLPAYSIIL